LNPKDLAKSVDNYESELSLLIKEMSLSEFRMADIVNKLSSLISKSELCELLDNLTINHAGMTPGSIMIGSGVYNRLCSMGVPFKVICRAPLSRWHLVISIVNVDNAEKISYVIHDKGYRKSLKKLGQQYGKRI